MNISHLIFNSSLADLQSQNPQRSSATPAVLLNQINQICPKSERDIIQLIFRATPKSGSFYYLILKNKKPPTLKNKEWMAYWLIYFSDDY